jgi:hypothetical protein
VGCAQQVELRSAADLVKRAAGSGPGCGSSAVQSAANGDLKTLVVFMNDHHPLKIKWSNISVTGFSPAVISPGTSLHYHRVCEIADSLYVR